MRKTKKLYFHSLNTKNITDSGTYWESVVPLFAKKVSKGEKILFNEGEKHISDDKKIWTIFNSFFSDVVADLKIPNHWNYLSQKNTHFLPTIIETLILNIKKSNLDSVFSFRDYSRGGIEVLRDLKADKCCQMSDTSTKIIKFNSDIFSNLIYMHFNYCIDKGEFLNDLKHADIVPVYKKNNKCKKENYRPVSILSNFSKVYEKLMCNKLYDYFDNTL